MNAALAGWPDRLDELVEQATVVGLLHRGVVVVVAEYERFRNLVGQVTEVNEAICQARPAVPGQAGGDAPPGPGGEKGTSSITTVSG